MAQGGVGAATHRCRWCGYGYDPSVGDPDRGVAPGTPYEALPADWVCPDCRAPQADFAAVGNGG